MDDRYMNLTDIGEHPTAPTLAHCSESRPSVNRNVLFRDDQPGLRH